MVTNSMNFFAHSHLWAVLRKAGILTALSKRGLTRIASLHCHVLSVRVPASRVGVNAGDRHQTQGCYKSKYSLKTSVKLVLQQYS